MSYSEDLRALDKLHHAAQHLAREFTPDMSRPAFVANSQARTILVRAADIILRDYRMGFLGLPTEVLQ